MERNIPIKYQPMYKRAMRGKSRKAAIRSFCLECVSYSEQEGQTVYGYELSAVQVPPKWVVQNFIYRRYVMVKKKKATPRKKVKKVRVRRRKVADTYKVVEITLGLGGVIPTAPYENLRPHFQMTVQPKRNADPNKIITHCENLLHKRFAMIEKKGAADLLEKQAENIGFREKGGLKYPRVSSILDFDVTWRIPHFELVQYASRGKIIHWLMNEFFKAGKWKDPTKEASLREDVSILLGGTKKFHWDDCSHRIFMKHYVKDIEILKFNQIVFNEEHFYSGEYDFLGIVDGKKSIIDTKTGDYKLMQLAAYAACEEGIEQLVVLPVGPCDNKSGYFRIVINDAIREHFKDFLRQRKAFKERFGL